MRHFANPLKLSMWRLNGAVHKYFHYFANVIKEILYILGKITESSNLRPKLPKLQKLVGSNLAKFHYRENYEGKRT